MIKIQTTIKEAIYQIRVFFDKAYDNSKDELGRIAGLIQSDMREPGKPISYPVQWDSPKQQRFVIAKLRSENNLPYTRINNYINGWTVARLANGFSISNVHPAGAIGGILKGVTTLKSESAVASSWQSKIHRGRWRKLVSSAVQRLGELPKRILDRLKVSFQ